MKSIILLPLCFALAFGAGAPYSFGYTTADGQMRQESGSGGSVTGSYSYTDANGDLRQVNYVADALGFRAEGDISVDRRTAAAAANLAALAPKGTAGPLALGLGAPAIAAPYATQFAAPYATQLAAPISQFKLDSAPISQFKLDSAPIAAPFTTQFASPALAYKSRGIPAYNTLATGPAFSSYGTSISHGSNLIAPAGIPAIGSPLITAPGLLRSYDVMTPTHRIYAKI
jgi:hypothetical protein